MQETHFTTPLLIQSIGRSQEHVYKSASSTIQQKYKTSYEGFAIAFDDKRKGEKTESKFTVTLPKDTIPDQSLSFSFGVKDVKDSCNIDKGYVSFEYAPCDWMGATAKYNIAKERRRRGCGQVRQHAHGWCLRHPWWRCPLRHQGVRRWQPHRRLPLRPVHVSTL